MNKLVLIAGAAFALTACNAPKEQKVETENPFFTEYTTPFGVPPFDQIKIEHYLPAFEKGMQEQAQEIEAIVNQKSVPDFENTIVPLDQSGKLLRKVSAVFYGQNSANTSDEMQELSKQLSPMLSKHEDDISLNPKLFERVKQVYENRDKMGLNKEQAKLLEETYKDFVRGGANLDAEKQAKLRELNSEIAMLQLTFGQNMLKETNDFQLIVDKKEDLSGLPESLIANAAETAKAAGQEGKWIFTLHNPSVKPFLQYADNRALREQIFKGYINRGNNNNDADNKEVVRKLVAKRLEKAKLMGYKDYASFVLEDRMAKNSENVYKLLDEVWTPALNKAKEELADIQAEIKKEGQSFEAEGWDWRYYFEKAKKAKFDLDENQIRPYLPLNQVREGAFYVANKLYGITFTELKDIPLPHPDALAFECKDKDGTHLGVLYMDCFPRASQRGGAWCGTYRSQTYVDGKRQGPVVTIVCNFTQPAAGQPALLSADEASTLFHEFGHGLHNQTRFSGRYEVVMWYTKTDNYTFNLDPVRIPSKYPSKRSYRGENKGKLSCNPLGKNPEDVWDIPNVKGNHVEKEDHPCQFPVGLIERLVLSMTNEGDLVFDPFSGTASSGVAALLHNRNFWGCEIMESYIKIGQRRLQETLAGTVRYRPHDKPIYDSKTSKLSKIPDEWKDGGNN